MSKYIDELTELICDTVRTVFPNASLDDGYDVADEVIAKLPTIEADEDCISREYLEEKLQQIEDITAMAHIDLGEDPYDETDEITMPISTVRKIFKNAPSVVSTCQKNRQVERAEGEWKFKKIFPNDDSEFPMGYLVCSVCGSSHANATPCNYCDNCGAKMKGVYDD